MSDESTPASLDSDDVDAAAILKRRDFLVKSAILAASASLGAACDEPGDGGPGPTIDACLSVAAPDAEPEICLSAPVDILQDRAADDGTPQDAGPDPAPEVCLSPRRPDSGTDSEAG